MVKGGNHHVIFEYSLKEQADGIWETVDGSGSSRSCPTTQFPHYNHVQAQRSVDDDGNLIQIRIKKLESGKSILFACSPHSESRDGTGVPMLGKIVLNSR